VQTTNTFSETSVTAVAFFTFLKMTLIEIGCKVLLWERFRFVRKTGAPAELLVRVRVSLLCREDEKIYRVIQKSRYAVSICECKLM